MTIIRVLVTLSLAWSAFKGVEVLARATSMDYLLFAGAGVGWLLYLLLVPAIIASVSGVVWIWRPFPKGFQTSLFAIVLNMLETVIGGVISMLNTDLAKQSFVSSREARGLPIRPEILKMMDSPASHVIPIVIAIAMSAFWIFLLFKIRRSCQTRTADSSARLEG